MFPAHWTICKIKHSPRNTYECMLAYGITNVHVDCLNFINCNVPFVTYISFRFVLNHLCVLLSFCFNVPCFCFILSQYVHRKIVQSDTHADVLLSARGSISLTSLAEQTHVFPMEDNTALHSDEILGTYGNIGNFCLDLLIDPPSENEEITLVHLSPYYGANRLTAGLSHPYLLNVLSLHVQSLYA